jgi:putative transcriptional regulator
MADEPPDYLRATGDRLYQLRQSQGWSQEDAARAVGVSVTTWRAWETAKREPYEANWRKISEAFNVDVGILRGLPNPDHIDIHDRMLAVEEEIRDRGRRITQLEEQVAEILNRLAE